MPDRDLTVDFDDMNTLRKAQALAAERGMRLSGFILTNDRGERALVELGAVRWLDSQDMWALMHPGSALPPV